MWCDIGTGTVHEWKNQNIGIYKLFDTTFAIMEQGVVARYNKRTVLRGHSSLVRSKQKPSCKIC